MYKCLRAHSGKNPNPVLVGRQVTATTSKQITAHLLCAECEDLFNKKGEREMLKWAWNGKRFPLGDRLSVANPHLAFPQFLAFSGAAAGIDTAKLAYFALSVVWRAAVHKWDLPFGGSTTVLDLRELEEPIRQYLHGDTGFPTDVAVIPTACTDRASMTFYTPSPALNVPGTAFGMLMLGVHFFVYIGTDIPPAIRQVCCVRSGQRLIFQRNCEQKTIDAFAQLMKTSRPATGLE
jgi:hypothetical protein